MEIPITHQEDKEVYTFQVKNPDHLTSKEVSKICKKMNVKIILVNGRIYKELVNESKSRFVLQNVLQNPNL